MAKASITVSLTEVPHFHILVAFLEEVERHADAECDVALQALVHECRERLMDECR